jgi:imidazoleglycerol phosphate dehydratase HisB
MNQKSRAETARDRLEADAYQDAAGVWRWKSNDAVPFDQLLAEAGIDYETRSRCRAAREIDVERQLEDYRRAQASRTPEEIAEQRAMARAAQGPGVEIVDIVTGEKYTT